MLLGKESNGTVCSRHVAAQECVVKKTIVAVIAFTLSATVMVVPAGSQEQGGGETPPETTTTTAPVATTTTAPTTTVADTPPETTTTVADAPPETTTTVVDGEPGDGEGGDLEIIELPGENVSAGTLNFGVEFYENEAANCTGALNIGGGNMNVVKNDVGNLGVLYGTEATGSGTAAVFMIELGAVPAAVAVLSVSDANCEFDAVGVGNFEATATTMSIDGVGAGLYPGVYDQGEFVSSLQINAEVSATNGPAVLDLEAAEAFLTRARGE